ncbi:MAG: hypothetical protein ACRDV6_02635 [Acidimicrobiales bacterium]
MVKPAWRLHRSTIVLLSALLGMTSGVAGTSASAAPTEAPSTVWLRHVIVHSHLSAVPTPVVGSTLAYGISTSATTDRYGRLTMLDEVTGALTMGGRLPIGSQLFSFGQAIVALFPALERPSGAAIGPWSIRVIKKGLLAWGKPVVLHVPAPTVPNVGPDFVQATSGPAIDGDDFWVRDGNSIFLVDRATGRVVRQRDLGADVTSLALSPTGKRLYVALDELDKKGLVRSGGPAAVVLEELDASDGASLAKTAGLGGVGLAELTAVPGAVWESARGGNAGSVVVYSAHDLRLITRPSDGLTFGVPHAGAAMMMGIEATYVAGAVWLSNVTGSSCVDPGTGRFRSGSTSLAIDGFWTPFAVVAGTIYGAQILGGTSPPLEIVAVNPPASCSTRS